MAWITFFFLLDFFSQQGTELQAASTELRHLQNLESPSGSG